MLNPLAFIFSLYIAFVTGTQNIGSVGPCPYNTPNLNISVMPGIWHYTYGVYNPYEPQDNCPMVEIFKTSPDTIYVIKTSIKPTGNFVKIYENVKKVDDTGFLNVTYNSLGADQYVMITSMTPTYYTLVYCSKNNDYVGTAAEILTRASNPDDDVVNSAKDDLKRFGVDISKIKPYNQKNCYAEPKIYPYSSSELSKMSFSSSA